MEAAFCSLKMLMIKNDESQIAALLCFYLRGLMQRETVVRFARILPFIIYNILRKKIISDFRILTAMPSSG
jgi:hypothetical protein